MSRRPRLLFLTQRALFPMNEGGKIRTANILREMKGGTFEIVLATPETDPPGAFAAEQSAICDRAVTWTARPIRGWRRIGLLPGRLPVSVSSHHSPAARAVMAREIAAGPDLVVVDFPHAAILVPEKLPPSVLFTHNVEAEIFGRHARTASGLWRLVWLDQERKMRRFEREVMARFDAVIAVSARDAFLLKQDYAPRRTVVIDTGVDAAYHTPQPEPPEPPADGGVITFTAAMDSLANIEGLSYLLDEIWPRLIAARPALKAIIVGRNPPQSLVARAKARGANWQFTGAVADVRPFVAEGHVSVIPLRVGSGTRIKVFEAMAAGRAIVSTSIGIEGLPVEPNHHFLAGDTPDEFAQATLRVLSDTDLRRRLARDARELVESRFSWAVVARQFEEICRFTLSGA